MFKFEKLNIWKEAIRLTGEIHKLTRSFPKEELYILSSQIKRAADSVALNIAEGSTGQSNAQFKQFLIYANRSALEVVSCLFVGKERNIVNQEQFSRFYDEYQVLIKMIQALIKTLK